MAHCAHVVKGVRSDDQVLLQPGAQSGHGRTIRTPRYRSLWMAMFAFDSNAILLFLAEKTGQFLPEDSTKRRGELLSWLMFIASGIGPYSGQAVHFRHHAPKGMDYAVERYLFEARRHYGILDAQLADKPYPTGREVHHRRYGGLGMGACSTVRHRRGGVEFAAAIETLVRQHQCAASRRSRRSAEGQIPLQGRARRGSQAASISACEQRLTRAHQRER